MQHLGSSVHLKIGPDDEVRIVESVSHDGDIGIAIGSTARVSLSGSHADLYALLIRAADQVRDHEFMGATDAAA